MNTINSSGSQGYNYYSLAIGFATVAAVTIGTILLYKRAVQQGNAKAKKTNEYLPYETEAFENAWRNKNEERKRQGKQPLTKEKYISKKTNEYLPYKRKTFKNDWGNKNEERERLSIPKPFPPKKFPKGNITLQPYTKIG